MTKAQVKKACRELGVSFVELRDPDSTSGSEYFEARKDGFRYKINGRFLCKTLNGNLYSCEVAIGAIKRERAQKERSGGY